MFNIQDVKGLFKIRVGITGDRWIFRITFKDGTNYDSQPMPEIAAAAECNLIRHCVASFYKNKPWNHDLFTATDERPGEFIPDRDLQPLVIKDEKKPRKNKKARNAD